MADQPGLRRRIALASTIVCARPGKAQQPRPLDTCRGHAAARRGAAPQGPPMRAAARPGALERAADRLARRRRSAAAGRIRGPRQGPLDADARLVRRAGPQRGRRARAPREGSSSAGCPARGRGARPAAPSRVAVEHRRGRRSRSCPHSGRESPARMRTSARRGAVGLRDEQQSRAPTGTVSVQPRSREPCDSSVMVIADGRRIWVAGSLQRASGVEVVSDVPPVQRGLVARRARS